MNSLLLSFKTCFEKNKNLKIMGVLYIFLKYLYFFYLTTIKLSLTWSIDQRLCAKIFICISWTSSIYISAITGLGNLVDLLKQVIERINNKKYQNPVWFCCLNTCWLYFLIFHTKIHFLYEIINSSYFSNVLTQ